MEALWRVASTPKAKNLGAIVGLLFCFAIALHVRGQMVELMGQHDYVKWAKEHYFGGITDFYLALASQLRTTHTYTVIAYPPGYPLFLAVLQGVGLDITGIRWVQITIDSLSVGAIYLLARSLTVARPLALLGSLTYAAIPLWAAASTLILAEWSSPAFVLWFLVLFSSAVRKQSFLRWGGLGLLSGMAGMFRPDLVLLVVVPFAWLVLRWRDGGAVKCGAWVLGGFFVVVGSWGLHNRVQQGVWVFTSTGGGIGLWEGLGEIPNSYAYVTNDEHVGKMMAERGMLAHTPEGNRYLMGEYFKAWQDHPLYVLRTISSRWIKIVFYMDTFEAICGPSFASLSSVAKRYGLFVLLAAMILKRRDLAALVVLAVPLGYALMSIGLTHYEPRYVRFVPFSYLLSAIVALAWFIAIVARRVPKAASALSIALLATAVAYVAQGLVGLGRVVNLNFWRSASDLVLVRALPQIDWVLSEGVEVEKDMQGNLDIETNVEEYAYQALFTLDDLDCDFVFARYKVRIEDGGMTVGALRESGQWAVTNTSTDLGWWEGDLAIDTKGDDKLTFVLANDRLGGGRSRFTLSELNVYVPPTCEPAGFDSLKTM